MPELSDITFTFCVLIFLRGMNYFVFSRLCLYVCLFCADLQY